MHVRCTYVSHRRTTTAAAVRRVDRVSCREIIVTG